MQLLTFPINATRPGVYTPLFSAPSKCIFLSFHAIWTGVAIYPVLFIQQAQNTAVRCPQLSVCGITMERWEGLHPKPKDSERGIPMTKFSHVIIRRPGKSLCNGITSAPELGQPIYERAIEEHYDYEHALEQCGVDVTVLPALEEYPDSCFVEDPPLSLAAAPLSPILAQIPAMARRTKSSPSSVVSSMMST